MRNSKHFKRCKAQVEFGFNVLNLLVKKISVISLSVTSIMCILGSTKNVLADVFSVNISGTVLQTPFQRTGYLQVVPTITQYGTQNGVNPYDVFLQSGYPGSNPQTGSIWFMSNNAFIGSASRLDLAYVTWYPQYALLRSQPDSRIAATGANLFTAKSSLTATPYQIYDGYMDVQFFNGGSISGFIDVIGKGYTIYNPANRYTARINGTFLSRSLKQRKSSTSEIPFSAYPDKRIRLRIKPGANTTPLPPPPAFDPKAKTRMKLR